MLSFSPQLSFAEDERKTPKAGDDKLGKSFAEGCLPGHGPPGSHGDRRRKSVADALNAITYPDIEELEEKIVGEACVVSVPDLTRASQSPPNTATLELMSGVLGEMVQDPLLPRFHAAAQAAIDALAGVCAYPGQIDFSNMPSVGVYAVSKLLKDRFMRVQSVREEALARDRRIHDEWAGIEAEAPAAGLGDDIGALNEKVPVSFLQSLYQTVPHHVPGPVPQGVVVPAASAESPRRMTMEPTKGIGESSMWSWRRRVEFIRTVDVLQDLLQQRAQSQAAARAMLARLERCIQSMLAHKGFTKEVLRQYSVLESEYEDIATEAKEEEEAAIGDADAYMETLHDDKEMVVHEHDGFLKADAAHRRTFRRESQCPVTLRLHNEGENLKQELEALPEAMEKALSLPRIQLAKLKKEREEEVARALQESQKFLAKNSTEQEECETALTNTRAKYAAREEELKRLITENVRTEQEAWELHQQRQRETNAREERRKQAMTRLISGCERHLVLLDGAIADSLLPLKLLRETQVPLRQRVGDAMAGEIRQARERLEEIARACDAGILTSVRWLQRGRGRLAASLLTTARAVTPVVASCRRRRQFCHETQDPAEEQYAAVAADLSRKQSAMRDEAVSLTRSIERRELYEVYAEAQQFQGVWSKGAIDDRMVTWGDGRKTRVQYQSDIAKGTRTIEMCIDDEEYFGSLTANGLQWSDGELWVRILQTPRGLLEGGLPPDELADVLGCTSEGWCLHPHEAAAQAVGAAGADRRGDAAARLPALRGGSPRVDVAAAPLRVDAAAGGGAPAAALAPGRDGGRHHAAFRTHILRPGERAKRGKAAPLPDARGRHALPPIGTRPQQPAAHAVVPAM